MAEPIFEYLLQVLNTLVFCLLYFILFLILREAR